MTLKDDDGSDIVLTLLQTPISLDNIDCHYKEKRARKKLEKKIDKKKNLKAKQVEMTILQQPICLEKLDWGDESDPTSYATLNATTMQGASSIGPSRKESAVEYQTWKENALTIFENSFVYPFVHAINKFKCFICSKPFLDANLLKEHTVNEHSFDDMQRELNNTVRNKTIKVDVTNTQCKICSETMPNLFSLKTHLKEHGKNIDADYQDNLIPFKLGCTTIECQVCGESFLKLRLLIIHMSKHFNNYNCEVCGSVFISHTLLKRHMQTHESGNFPCDKCDKVFSNAAKRTTHMRGVHLKQLPRRCPICSARFNSNYQRTKHLRVVHNQSTGLYRCETCGREYDLKYHLLVHVRSVHFQERNQECVICHSRFFSKYCLSRHMVIHTGEKNFKCDVCGKAYTTKKNMRKHAKTHEIVQATCSVCGQNCEDQTSLAAHINDSHGVL